VRDHKLIKDTLRRVNTGVLCPDHVPARQQNRRHSARSEGITLMPDSCTFIVRSIAATGYENILRLCLPAPSDPHGARPAKISLAILIGRIMC
jgi:hypothetical protein